MGDGTADLDLTRRETFSRWTTVTIRYGDQDAMGHVNNVIYAQWFEAARVPLIMELVDGHAGLDTVLARLIIDYLRETHYPGEVDIGARVTGIGNKSFDSAYGIFRGDECFSTSTCVSVFFDTERRRSATPPPAVRAALAAML